MAGRRKNKEADRYFVVNANDKDLTPIYLSLPKPPKLELIDGYGLDEKEQFFTRHELPEKLKNLEDKVFKELKDDYDKNNKNIITGTKILNKFWDLLEDESEYYEKEIRYIQKVIWHTIHGYWFYNHGKPTYICGWHYELLNFWFNPDIPSGYFEYRDRDRRKLLFDYYAYTTTETFSKVDDKGRAIKEDDGTYLMKDLFRRTSYGTIKPKNRRSGETHQGLLINWAIIRKSVGGFGTIVSKTGKDAVEYWNKKFLPAWDGYPTFLKPVWNGSKKPNALELQAPNNDFLSPSLKSFYYPTETADELANDGDKVVCALFDEQAKQNVKGAKVDVEKRWGVNKLTMSQGLNIHGFCTNPSTVEEMNAGGEIYYALAENSCFYERLPSGQTKSGLLRQYAPSQDGWEGFISPWGDSVDEDPSAELIRDTFWYCEKFRVSKNRFSYLDGRGAIRSLQEDRDSILAEDTPKAKIEYRRIIRKQPMRYEECWSGTTGGLDLPIEKMERAQAKLRKDDPIVYGRFEWENGVVDSNVVWVTDLDNGYIEKLEEPLADHRNNKMRDYEFVPSINEYIETWKPLRSSLYTCGVDSFGYSDELVATTGTSRSDGSFEILKLQDKNENKYEDKYRWDKFVISCRYRIDQDTFDEQVLMACVYYSAMMYPERNKESTYKHFVKRGYRGYLKFDVREDGKFESKPGYYASVERKTEGFERAAIYFDRRSDVEGFYRTIKEFLNMKSLKDMTKNDRVAARIAALLGSESVYGEVMESSHDTGLGDQVRSMLSRMKRNY